MAAGSKFHPKIVCQLVEGYCVFWFLGLKITSVWYSNGYWSGSLKVNTTIVVNHRSIWKNETQT